MYVKVTDGTPTVYTIGKLRKDNPNTSFPRSVPQSILDSYNVYPYTVADQPDYNVRTQTIEQGSITQVDGAWVQGWNIVEKDADAITAYDEGIASTVRTKRDILLAQTDYLALSDNTLSADMTTYRQALRDITTHANFPNLEDADWPTKPE